MSKQKTRGGALAAVMMMLVGAALAAAICKPWADDAKARLESHRDTAQLRLERALDNATR